MKDETYAKLREELGEYIYTQEDVAHILYQLLDHLDKKEDEKTILSKDDMILFLESLKNPPPPNEKMKELFKKYHEVKKEEFERLEQEKL